MPPKISDILEGRISCKIHLHDDSGEPSGTLEPLTRRHIPENDVIESMTRWRNRASRYFMTQFEATPERTRAWLSDTVLADSSRMLFLMRSPMKLVGHYGFKNLTSESAELDNLVRGEPGGHPRLVYHAELGMIRWLFDTFNLKRITAHVLSDNFPVLDMHRSVGFVDAELIPLRRVASASVIILEYGEAGTASADGLYCQKIILHRNQFEERHDDHTR